MEASAATGWWVAAGIAIAAELGTGTFYLLMMALGLAAGAIAAHFGLSVPVQFVAAAIGGGGSTAFWYWRKRARNGTERAVHENRNVNLDIGERVHVAQWASDRTAHVQYRGSSWVARLAEGAAPASGEHTVTAVEGNWLVLSPSAPR
jgi:membrane protein implicated in regulation of membrane protease activity